MTNEKEQEIKKLNAALPANSYQKIADKTGFGYQYVYDTMNLRFKKWNNKREKVEEQARRIIQNVQSDLL